MPRHLLALLSLSIAASFSQSLRAADAPAIDTSPAVDPAEGDSADRALLREHAKLTVARNGSEVNIRWELPEVSVRGVELLRNTRKETKGRIRVSAVSKKSIQHIDTVPDASATYWYWLKITLKDGQTVGVGPVPTPDAEVWTPSK